MLYTKIFYNKNILQQKQIYSVVLTDGIQFKYSQMNFLR
jgi:hypothetical protein